MLYAYLHFKDGKITRKIRKPRISPSFEEFVVACDLPTSKCLYTSEAPSFIEDFDFLSHLKLFFIKPSIGHKFPLTMWFDTLNARLILYVVTHVLISRKLNVGMMSKTDVVITWLLVNNVEINWSSTYPVKVSSHRHYPPSVSIQPDANRTRNPHNDRINQGPGQARHTRYTWLSCPFLPPKRAQKS
ncbi:unnamed protein product [Vicia faba]|uniref:Uncharacterized protein n=1 Tax=Vicia faba TaxID=3906 RepID=A0AAV1AAL7_VICFA|nr:unnamed protein product [Vicia faba]